MSGPVSIGSTTEWQSLLSSTNVVVADFYADWCGPCKMIAPHFERLAKEHSRPKKVAFAKVNVDTQSTVASSNGVSAMPTFKIFHGGNCIDTIEGANPSGLSEAVLKALKLADIAGGGNKPGVAFKTPGRTLGGEAPSALAASGGGWNMGSILDARNAAESSWFNIHKAGARGEKSEQGRGTAKPAPKPAFRTLADLGSE
ncbi:Thioredoxin-like protein [Tolypocladium capitatum]|uniref:Thioredoxin-like protein n=1 Tax=Tolypocladium capitatum TaxID=45235 RepID=A0A2K3QLA3_9HYPO|nr:Thioredoxin-like protein [Tolypocladium capitatum]